MPCMQCVLNAKLCMSVTTRAKVRPFGGGLLVHNRLFKLLTHSEYDVFDMFELLSIFT